jgi:hypothetical protein
MRTTSRWAALGAGLLLSTGLTACGGGTDVEDDPKSALAESIEALGDYDGIELLLSIDGDADALAAAADGDLDEDTTELLLDSTVLLRAAGEDESDAQAEVVVSLRGQESLELRVLPEQRFFVRVDLDAVGEALGDAELAATLDDLIGSADAFGLGEIADVVRRGDWIEVTGLEQFSELTGTSSASEEEPSEEEVEDVRERLVTTLQRFLDEDVAVVHVGEGTAGERVRATTTESDLAALFDEVATIVGDLSGVDPDAFAELPDASGGDDPIDIDFWLDGGELSQVGFDLAQLDEGGAPEGTYVLLGVEEFTGSVDAPDDPTQIDLFEIVGGLFGGPGGFDDLDEGDLEGLEEGELEEGDLGDGSTDPLGGECIPREDLDELIGDDEEMQAEIDAAIEMGFIEVC